MLINDMTFPVETHEEREWVSTLRMAEAIIERRFNEGFSPVITCRTHSLPRTGYHVILPLPEEAVGHIVVEQEKGRVCKKYLALTPSFFHSSVADVLRKGVTASGTDKPYAIESWFVTWANEFKAEAILLRGVKYFLLTEEHLLAKEAVPAIYDEALMELVRAYSK